MKYHQQRDYRDNRQSHPTGVRGLKYAALKVRHPLERVAPHWGAWIEISGMCAAPHAANSRTPLGCVD